MIGVTKNAEVTLDFIKQMSIFEVLDIPEVLITYNQSKFDGMEGFCIFLKRFFYPCRFCDLVSQFGQSVPQLSMMSNAISDHVYNNFNHLLHEFDQPWHRPVSLHEKGAPLENCLVFVDGTVRPICRLGVNQRTLCNGYKHVHSIKFQSVVIPNGLSNLFSPYKARQ